MLKMSKPSQSVMPHHISHTLNTQKAAQILTALSIFQGHSTLPSHHHTFCPLQTFRFSAWVFSPICQKHSGNKLYLDLESSKHGSYVYFFNFCSPSFCYIINQITLAFSQGQPRVRRGPQSRFFQFFV